MVLDSPTRGPQGETREEGHSPQLRGDPGDLHLRQHVQHSQHRQERLDPRRRVQPVPPVLHRQAEDPRHRSSRRALPGPLWQEGRRQLAHPQRRSAAPITVQRTGACLLSTTSARPTRQGASMLDSALALVEEHAALESQMADPAIASDMAALREINKRYAVLAPMVSAYHAWKAAQGDLEAARELAAEDTGFAEEIPALEETLARAEA